MTSNTCNPCITHCSAETLLILLEPASSLYIVNRPKKNQLKLTNSDYYPCPNSSPSICGKATVKSRQKKQSKNYVEIVDFLFKNLPRSPEAEKEG